jgi:hypothetical protein
MHRHRNPPSPLRLQKAAFSYTDNTVDSFTVYPVGIVYDDLYSITD